jgi:guanosine-3',5'-bis(diphosphate) 3'-pyrophosphohydrolase
MTDRELPGDNILLLKAMDFGARRHAAQRRKGVEEVPYINHPIRVAWYIASIAEIQDARVLCAALLHDTIEDTSATEA